MRSAIIGMGDIYGIHLNALKNTDNVEIVAVCDINPACKANKPVNSKFYTDYKIMVKECELDCVHICLPHYLHYTVTKDIVEMGLGINVFCEKPVALNTEEAEEFAKLEINFSEIKIGICLQNRYNNTTKMLKEIIDNKEYGKVISCKGLVPWARPEEYYTSKPWRGTWKYAGGGCMINQAVHTLDLLQYLCGEVSSLKANVGNLLDYDIEVEDTVTARLKFNNGATGLFWATVANDRNENIQITVSLDKAEFIIDGGILYKIENGEKTFVCEDDKFPGEKFYYGVSHITLINKFYKAIQDDTQIYTHVYDAIESIKLIDAIHRSSNEDSTIKIK